MTAQTSLRAPNLKNAVISPITEGSVRKFLHDHIDPGVFAPDAVRTLIAAFDGAWQSIIASGARLSGQQKELTRELLAKYIIQQARQGELDQCRLRDGALLHLAQSNLRRPPGEQK
jgi:hypothetical protein